MKLNLNFSIKNDGQEFGTAASILARNLKLYPKSRFSVKMLDIAHKLEKSPEIEIDADDLQKLEEEISQYELATLTKGAILEAIIKAKQ